MTFVPEVGVLFAVGRIGDPEGLYSIRPETGSTQRIGNIGFFPASGGLAWVPEN